MGIGTGSGGRFGETFEPYWSEIGTTVWYV